jgi:hypothetical protein
MGRSPADAILPWAGEPARPNLRPAQATAMRAGSYGNKLEPIPFLRILAVSDREDLRGEHRPLT